MVFLGSITGVVLFWTFWLVCDYIFDKNEFTQFITYCIYNKNPEIYKHKIRLFYNKDIKQYVYSLIINENETCCTNHGNRVTASGRHFESDGIIYYYEDICMI